MEAAVNAALLAADIADRVPAMARDSRQNNFDLLLGLVAAEQVRNPPSPRAVMTKEQVFELTCLRDYLRRAVADKGNPDTDMDRWIEVLYKVLR